MTRLSSRSKKNIKSSIHGLFLASLLGVFLATVGCTRNQNEIWIYTSLYKEVIAEMEPLLKEAFPDHTVRWYQGGSETVASKVNAELAAGGTRADLILTSDPFWYYELKKAGKLLPYDSPAAKEVPAIYRDPENAFVTVRMPVMVIGYNSETYQPEELPKSWKDLADPKWKDKISMGSPLESGTNFTTVALLSKKYGWDYFQKLRELNIVAAGGNSSVMTRMETKERPIGIVLVENILKNQSKGSPVKAVYPNDGTIPVPSPIAILSSTKNPEGVKKIYDWFFSPKAQQAIVKGGMYSPLPGIASPGNAKEWKDLQSEMMTWNPDLLTELFGARDQVKAKFSEVVFH